MVQRPPFDRNSPPAAPGGFDPRFSEDRDYDRGPDPRFRSRADERYADPDPFDRGEAPRNRGRGRGSGSGGPNRWLLILGGLLILGAILFGLSLTRSGPGSDALNNQSEETDQETAAVANPEARCAAPATYEAIKRELFRQAAATRGSDEATFSQLAAYASLRVSKPVLREEDQGLERVSCQGDVALDLPPSVQVVGGRRTLTASLGYTLQPAADGSGDVVALSGTQGIVVPLATLARSEAPGSSNGDQPIPEPVEPDADPATPTPSNPPPPEATRANPMPDRTAPPPAVVQPTANARPSFNCNRARTRGEIAVCNSPELAALDRQMATFYVTSYRGAEPETRALLERTRNRFLTFRDRCRNDACVADAYRGRITEIRDIVDGRWRSPE